MPRVVTFEDVSNSSMVSLMIAEKTLLPNDTMNVINVVVTTIDHFRVADQLQGLSGSAELVHSTKSAFRVTPNSKCLDCMMRMLYFDARERCKYAL